MQEFVHEKLDVYKAALASMTSLKKCRVVEPPRR